MSLGDNSDYLYGQRISAEDAARLRAESAQTNMRAPFEDAARTNAGRLAALNALPQEIKLSPEMSSFLQFSEQYVHRAQLTGESVDARSQRIAYISMLNHNLRDHGYAELAGDQVNRFVDDGSPKHLPQRLNAEMPSSLKMYGEGEFEQLRNMVLRQAPAETAESGRTPAGTESVSESGRTPAGTENVSESGRTPAGTENVSESGRTSAGTENVAARMTNVVADMLPSAIADLLPRSNVGDMLSYMTPSATNIAPYMMQPRVPDGPTYLMPPYSYQPDYPPSMRSESVYMVPGRREEFDYDPPRRYAETPPRYVERRQSEPHYAPQPRRPEPQVVPPRVSEAPHPQPQNFAPQHQERPAPSKAELAEARQARQQLAELQALRQQYDFRSYLPIQKSTAERMLGFMPAEKQRALGNVFEKVSRDGHTITAADIDAYSIKYTGHKFFEHA